MINIDAAKSIVNCYSHTTNADVEIFKSRSDARQFAKWLELVLNVSIANDVLLNNRSMDECLKAGIFHHIGKCRRTRKIVLHL